MKLLIDRRGSLVQPPVFLSSIYFFECFIDLNQSHALGHRDVGLGACLVNNVQCTILVAN